MNFAVVEYTSKSGQVWQHTDEKPNYLCDPASEMDPTSFGCYVSALRGKHIPLTVVIGADKIGRRLRRKLTGDWPTNYALDMFADYNLLMVIYEVANGPTLTKFARRVKKVYPGLKVLGVPTQPYGLLRQQWQSKPRVLTELKEFMAAGDAFLTIVKSTLPRWRQLADVPVYYLPQPYPVRYAKSLLSHRRNKQEIIYVAGVTARPNIKKGLMVAKIIQTKRPQYKIQVVKVDGVKADWSSLEGTNFEGLKFMPWREHLQYLAGVKLVINTDYTQTRGRVQMDCAVCGTPSVGANADAQLDLYPSYASGPRDTTDNVAKKAIALLDNQDEYQRVNEYAAGKIDFYNYYNSAQRVIALTEAMGSK